MEHFCTVHNCSFYKNEKNGKTWYSHKIKGGSGYCNESKEVVFHSEIDADNPVETKDSPLVKAALNMGAEKVVQPSPDATKSNSKPITPPVGTSTPPNPKNEQDYWDEKNKNTRKSIERQKALEIAASLQIEQTNHPDKIIMVAKKFERYLETGE
jgi:hypothetical protein